MVDDDNVINESTEYTINTNLIGKNLFGIPIYKTRFKHHSVLKPQWMEYLSDKENFRKNTKTGRLLFTSPNIHKEKIFEPLSEFILESLKVVMEDNGFTPDIGLTGMWATVHPDGGYHHRHHHHNAYWAGVYYLDGNDQSSGTTFYSPYHYNNIITPKRIKNTKTKMHNEYNSKFEEGVLIIFPAWLQHSTSSNNYKSSGKYRKIISFNSMPIGATNTDPFDRYFYAEPDSKNMVNFGEDLIDYDPNFEKIVDNLDYFNTNDLAKDDQPVVINEINTLRSEVDSIKDNINDVKNMLLKVLENNK
jgi:uncharacterized protein (TIGR02466 family)